ncbi:MAG TPA: hypothetical protein VF516_25845 [Kofleriaceae bacterium]
MLRAPEPIHAVSGSPDHAFAAIGGSIVRVSSSGSADLAFDAGTPIVALTAVPSGGVVFSTSLGTFFLGDNGEVARISKLCASAIEGHGDDLYFVFDAAGIVHASPASALATLPDIDENRVVAAAPAPAPFTPESPPRPPRPPPFVFPAGDFRDIRLTLFRTSRGGYSESAVDSPSPSQSSSMSGSMSNGTGLRFERTASSGFPGLVWSLGLDFDLTTGGVVKPHTTLYSMAAQLAFGYGVPLGHYVQVELVPYGEVVGDAIDHPFSSQVAWGSGVGVGGRLQVLYTVDTGMQLGIAADYNFRWLSLAGSCDGCTTTGGFAVTSYNASVTTAQASIGLVVGKRY